MKRLISIFIALLMFVPINVFASVFSDIKDTDYYLKAATALEKLDILAGYPDGTFGAEKTITRAEMAAIVCRMIDKEKDSQMAKGETDFNDVRAECWASGYINIASKEGIINGYGNGEFQPDNKVKHEEAIKMVVCAMGYKDEVTLDNKDWSKGYLEVADKKDISDELKGRKGEFSTRGDIAVMAYNGLATNKEDSKIPAKPVASKVAGEYTGTQKVKLTTVTKDAVIYYTKDGTTPTAKSNKYTIDISITETCTLKAVAIKDGIVSKDLIVCYTIKKISGGGGGGGDGGGSGSENSTQTKPEVYTVSFDLNYSGATDAPKTQEITSGDKVTIPTVPVREGFVFKGWTLSGETKELYDFNSSVKKNLTLYALWEEIIPVFTVSFNLNYEGAINPVSQTVEKGNCAIEPEVLKRDGFFFVGWYEDSSYSELFNFSIPVTKDYSLVARWNAINPPQDNEDEEDEDENTQIDMTQDTDEDGLTDYFEINCLNTDPFSCDTDMDELTDYDEINIHATKPDSDDTDGDGLSDGDEIKLGLNPFLQKTDGTALDLTRTFSQTLSTQNIAQILLSEENRAIPSLSMNAVGNIDSKTRIITADADALKSNTAVVGMPIFISTACDFVFSDAIISFSVDEDSLNQYLICEYTSEDFIPLKTTYSDGGLSAKIERPGTYFVLDTEIFLANLGINPLNYFYPVSSLATQTQYQADIVFIIDKTNSMWEPIDNIFNSVESFADDLLNKQINARFSLIEYQDITKDGFGSTIQHKNTNSDWWDKDSIEDFKNEIQSMRPDDGGDLPETPIDGLCMARNLVSSSSANKFFILITDAPYKENNQYGVKNMDEMIELLIEDGINVSLITKDWDYPTEPEYDLVGWYLLGDGHELIERTDVYHDKVSDEYFYYTLEYDYETNSRQPKKNYVEKDSVGFDIRVGSIAIEDMYEVIICDVYYDVMTADYYYIKNDCDKSGREYFKEIAVTDVDEIIFKSDNEGKVSGYKSLYEKTGGLLGNINHNFSNTLKAIVTMIDDSITNSSVVILDNYETVMLQKPLAYPHPADTDRDGIYDIDELIDLKNADLKEYLLTYLKARGLTYENYIELGGKQYLTVWSYKSRPDRTDTDGDGLSDLGDQSPKIWDITERDLSLLVKAVCYDLKSGTVLSDTDISINTDAGTSENLKELKGWRVAESFYSPLSTFKSAAYIKDNNMVIVAKGEEDTTKLNLQIPQMKIFIKNLIKRYYGKYDNFYVTGNDRLVPMISEELEKAGVRSLIYCH